MPGDWGGEGDVGGEGGKGLKLKLGGWHEYTHVERRKQRQALGRENVLSCLYHTLLISDS